MSPLLRTLRTVASACLLAAGAALASTPAPEDPVASLQSAYARAAKPGEQAVMYRDLFPDVFHRLERSYAWDVDVPALATAAMKVLEPLPAESGDASELFNKAMREALRTLDPYTRYIDPSRHASERSEATGVFGGLGMELESSGGAIRVVAPMPDSPAARAGVQAGDIIVRLEGEPLTDATLSDVVSRMRGAPGTTVTLTLRRAAPGEEVTLSMTREVIRRQVLRWTMEGDVLVLRLASFSGSATSALEQAVAAAAARAPKGIVLDMRGNGGGLFGEAVRTADAFLASGDIVSLRGRTGNPRTWQADPNQLLAGVPMVVLLDGRSASAAELVAIALQENGRATVMGQKSFGKGTVQTTYGLGENRGAIKLTSSVYLSPKGRSLHKAGLVPDVELGAAEGASSADAKAHVDPARCTLVRSAADPGLSCALTYLAAGSIDAFASALADARP